MTYKLHTDLRISHEHRPDYMTPEQWQMSVQRAALIGAANTIIQEWNKWMRAKHE